MTSKFIYSLVCMILLNAGLTLNPQSAEAASSQDSYQQVLQHTTQHTLSSAIQNRGIPGRRIGGGTR